jgi:hypothetical protein
VCRPVDVEQFVDPAAPRRVAHNRHAGTQAACGVIMWLIKRFLITIEGPGWEDFEDVELLQLPGVGEPIETKFGTCLVTQTDSLPDTEAYEGKIVCRMP